MSEDTRIGDALRTNAIPFGDLEAVEKLFRESEELSKNLLFTDWRRHAQICNRINLTNNAIVYCDCCSTSSKEAWVEGTPSVWISLVPKVFTGQFDKSTCQSWICNECRYETDVLTGVLAGNSIFTVEVSPEKTNVGTWVIRDTDAHPIYEKRTRASVMREAIADEFEALLRPICKEMDYSKNPNSTNINAKIYMGDYDCYFTPKNKIMVQGSEIYQVWEVMN